MPGHAILRTRVAFAAAIAAATLVLIPYAYLRAQTGEEVASFASDITVREDGVIEVVEHIDYHFPSPRHGIFRTIPLRYQMDDGRTLVVPIDDITVTGAPFKVHREKNLVDIQIGDPDRTVTGTQSYVVSYTATGALRYFDDHDELYWNVTGTAWDVPVRRASAAVHLPATVPSGNIIARCFTGPHGSTSEDCLFNTQGTTVNFAANDMLTAVVGWRPTGLVAKVEAKTPFPWGPVLGFGFLAGVPFLAFFLMYRKWRQSGRDRGDTATLVVQYEPPDGLRPAEMGVIADENVDHRDISATIVDLAVRGHLKIIEGEKKLLGGKSMEFVRTIPAAEASDLRPFERKLLDVMFGAGTKASVDDLVKSHVLYNNIGEIKKLLYEDAVTRGYFAQSPDKVRQKYQGIGIGIMLASMFIVFFIAGLLGSAVLFLGIGGALAGIVVLSFAGKMPGKTEKGTQAYMHTLGFREYLDRAEKYRLEWQEKERMFETFLPYAMAFDVVDHWSKAFAGMQLPPPKWYEGPSSTAFGGGFNAGTFAASMNSLGKSVSTAATSRPESQGSGWSSSGGWSSSSGSGFGGGGSSGGGFGGGGGRSW